MRWSSQVLGPLAFLAASLGCGQVEPVGSAEQSAPSGNAPTGSATAAPQNPAPPPSATAALPPPPPGTCGAMVSARSFTTADNQADALHGLWIGCTADRPPSLCPAPDTSMFFGTLDPRTDPGSRAAACGHVTSHGDGFIENAAYRFTYEVKNLAPAGDAPSYVLRVWNETTDRTFALSYRDSMATTGSLSEGTITLGEPDGHPGTLRRSAFTTF